MRWQPINCKPAAALFPPLSTLFAAKWLRLSDQKLNIAMTFIGSMSGALLVQYVQADVYGNFADSVMYRPLFLADAKAG
ncbi:hypothetical protein ACLK2A_12735 [Escherichia coli]